GRGNVPCADRPRPWQSIASAARHPVPSPRGSSNERDLGPLPDPRQHPVLLPAVDTGRQRRTDSVRVLVRVALPATAGKKRSSWSSATKYGLQQRGSRRGAQRSALAEDRSRRRQLARRYEDRYDIRCAVRRLAAYAPAVLSAEDRQEPVSQLAE